LIRFAPTDQTAIAPKKSTYSMVAGQNDRMAGSVPVWNEGQSFAENLAASSGKDSKDSSFGIADVVDMINPLQHIPLVSNLYQSVTGDTMGGLAQIVGGAIFGGPIGALASAGMVAYQSAKAQEAEGANNFLDGTTIALADLRQGYRPYNS